MGDPREGEAGGIEFTSAGFFILGFFGKRRAASDPEAEQFPLGVFKDIAQVKVEHLKESVESARRLYSAGELTYADLLAYQAELLKAEAELTAAGGTVTEPPAKSASDGKPR